MKVAKKHEGHGFSQFELSKNVLHNLKHFDLTPTGKLVLLVLVDCFNPENNAVVFPSMEFIADMAGIGLTATKQAIKDLILTGCIIKSKRGKIRGNYNKYLLTLKVRNTTSEQSENELLKQSDSDRFHEEQKKRTKKEQTNIVALQKTDVQILQQYAKEHGASNIQGYINALKIKGVAADIICQYREKEGVSKYWEHQAAQTSELIKQMREQKGDPMPESFRALKAKLKTACNYQM
jgi:hypothetical protein